MSRQRFGIHRPLEDEADRLIRESLKGVTAHSAKSDILTAWKEGDRRSKEMYVASGTPDAAIRQGMFHRALNRGRPELNSRSGIARPRTDSLSSFYEENGDSDT